MSKQELSRIHVLPGRVRVESRVAVCIRCPICQREHHHILTARDHPDLPGTRYWSVDCCGSRHFLGVASTRIGDAVALTTDIATEYALSQQWLAQDPDEDGCYSHSDH